MQHEIRVKGHYYIKLYGPDGVLKREVDGSNVVVTNGKDFLASFLNSASTAASTFTMRYIAIGDGAVGELVGDAALGNELARVTGNATYTSGGLYEVLATFVAGVGTGAITEYGLFSTATTGAGTLFSRDTESVINKAAGDTLTVTTKVTFS